MCAMLWHYPLLPALKTSQLSPGCKAWLHCPLIVTVLFTSYRICWPWNLGWGLLNYVNNLTVFHRTLVYNLGSVFSLAWALLFALMRVLLFSPQRLIRGTRLSWASQAYPERRACFFRVWTRTGQVERIQPLLLVFTRVGPLWSSSTSVLVASSSFLGPAGFCVQGMDTGADTSWY